MKSSMEELFPIMTDKLQTLSFYVLDVNEIRHQLRFLTPFGIDRIIPLGRTMEFDLHWDGFDLISEMSIII